MKQFLSGFGALAIILAGIAAFFGILAFAFYSIYGVSVGVQALLNPYLGLNIWVIGILVLILMSNMRRLFLVPYLGIGIWATHTIWGWALWQSLAMYLGVMFFATSLAVFGGSVAILFLLMSTIKKFVKRT